MASRNFESLLGRTQPEELSRWREIEERLIQLYPGSSRELCELDFVDPFQLGVATILSAQCTDVVVNSVLPDLFGRFPDAGSLSGADPTEVEELIRRTGFFRNKAKNIIGFARCLLELYEGTVPRTIDELVKLPGVGRKTANVIVTVAYGLQGIAVDTHVQRLSKRLRLSDAKDPVGIEMDLMQWLSPGDGGGFGLRLILHGRRVCSARRPQCEQCSISDLCPTARVVDSKQGA